MQRVDFSTKLRNQYNTSEFLVICSDDNCFMCEDQFRQSSIITPRYFTFCVLVITLLLTKSKNCIAKFFGVGGL